MADRSSRPHQCPARTHRRLERKVAHLRTKQLGPAAIAGRLGMHASTVHRVLVRLGCPKLSAVDLATGQPIRRPPVIRYEHAAPGDLVHVDIKKLGTIPDGGGHRAHGRSQAKQNNDLPAVRRRASHSYVHTAIDDNSRLAYSEILPDETGPTAAAFWTRAHAWFAAAGITVVRVLTDNGGCYQSRAWKQAMALTDCRHKRTRPYRPQTNGKVERFNRTLQREWAYQRIYTSDAARARALPRWLHIYNNHRPHTALGGRPPASRVTNLSGQYI